MKQFRALPKKYPSKATWTADDNIYDAKDATNAAGLSGVDTMSWFCDAGGGGTAGIAFLGTLCVSGGWNTNLNERQWSAAGTGFVSLIYQIFLLYVSLTLYLKSLSS